MNTKLNYSSSFLENFSGDIESLEKNAKEYPYSALVNFLLLSEYKKEASEKYVPFQKKAVLYFQNPSWLQFQLQKTTVEDTETEVEKYSRGEEESELNFPIPEIEETQNEIEEEILPYEEKSIHENTFPEGEKPAAILLHEEIENTNPPEDEKPEDIPDQEEKEVKHVEIVSTTSENRRQELLFEPLSMSDYFASQGISIKPEALLNDKLGRQMKSFTEWLKEMKNIHAGKLPEQNPAVERMIQMTSEKSNVDAEILTETMAEILLKQEKPEKAIELYEKLSLMNPSKSIYFAAKIDSIKNQ